MTRGRTLLALLGTAATAGAVGLLVVPPSQVRAGPLAELLAMVPPASPTTVLLGLAAGAGLYLLGGLLFAEEASDPESAAGRRFETLASRPVEAATATETPRVGGQFDDRLGRLAEQPKLAEDLREELRTTAIQTYAQQEGVDETAARTAIDTGTWTDDRVAAAFLARDEEVIPPLWARLRAWADPDAEASRRVHRTVAAIEARLADREGDP